MKTLKHSYPLTILESHLDTFEHVNNAVYLVLFEEARWDLITNNGYGIEKIKETGLSPIILAVNVRFKKELKLRQKISIDTQLHSYDKKIAVIHQKIKDEKDIIYCTAEFTAGLFDTRKRKLVSPTQEWMRALGVCSN